MFVSVEVSYGVLNFLIATDLILFFSLHFLCCFCVGGAGGKGVWGAAGMVYEDEEPDARDPNYDEVAQV